MLAKYAAKTVSPAAKRFVSIPDGTEDEGGSVAPWLREEKPSRAGQPFGAEGGSPEGTGLPAVAAGQALPVVCGVGLRQLCLPCCNHSSRCFQHLYGYEPSTDS